MKSIVFLSAVYALLLCTLTVRAEVEKDAKIEQSTESPIADMALLDAKVDDMKIETVKEQAMTSVKPKEETKAEAQPHTIADFIIHPLIALKPRLPEVEGKQADTGSTTTPSPWQLFGFNAGQGLGSSVSSLAGSVTGWLGNRIQLPGLVDTPVRESSTTSTSTTTTPKPEVVVRVKQRPSTKKPLISIKGDDERPYRKTKRPNRFNANRVEDESEEEDDDDFYDEDEEEVSNNKRRRYQNNNEEDDDEEDDDDGDNNEHDDEYEEDDEAEDDEDEDQIRPVNNKNKRRRNSRPLNYNNNNNNNNKRRYNVNHSYNQRRRFNNNGNGNGNNSRKRNQQQQQQHQNEEMEQYDDDQDQEFYYNKNQGSKRSQNEQNFIQRGQQTLLKQIKQFTSGQTPAEIGQTINKSQKSGTKKRRNQATLIINRNGQAIYVAPELLQVTEAFNEQAKPTKQQISLATSHVKRPTSYYPQPPLTVPYRRKGKPTQYITIPWSQLGISPPDQIAALSDGVQSQPLILNIPQKAIDSMQYPKPGKKRPVITPEAVPLLAEASIMDIFKPPRIPPARTPTSTKPTKKASTASSSNTPVVIATKTKSGPARIRPATLVEKSPAIDNHMDEKMTSEELSDNEMSHLIVIGDESGESRQLSRNAYRQILEYFNTRTGRQLKLDEATNAHEPSLQNTEQLIPVQVISAEEAVTETPKIDNKMADVTEIPLATANEEMPKEMEAAVENATESPMNV